MAQGSRGRGLRQGEGCGQEQGAGASGRRGKVEAAQGAAGQSAGQGDRLFVAVMGGVESVLVWGGGLREW